MRFHNRSSPKDGSANRLGAAFIRDLDADYRVNGVDSIRRLRRDELHNYLKLVLSLVPREFDLEVSPFADVGTNELIEIIKRARERLAAEKTLEETAKNQADSVSNAVDSAADNAISLMQQ